MLKETGLCPITNEPLGTDDLVVIAASKAVKPRPVAATSIPGLLTLFQNEWDATMLEVFQLRQTLRATRLELSQTLYQHDAATRVIARLIKERDTLRQQLESAGQQAAPVNGKRGAVEPPVADVSAAKKKARTSAAVEVAVSGLPETVIQDINTKSAELQQGRRKRALGEDLASPDDVKGLKLVGTYPLHLASKGGIHAVAALEGSDLVFTAGVDGTLRIFDRSSEREIAVLKGHGKKVLSLAIISGEVFASGGADGSCRLWHKKDGDDTYVCTHIFDDQKKAEIVSLAAHPSGKFLVSAASNGKWCMYDVESHACLLEVSAPAGISSAALHPDGVIYAIGSVDSEITLYDVRTQTVAATFKHGGGGGIKSIAFSENGYYMASSASDGVKVWDLRKQSEVVSLAGLTAVAFDVSGLYLATGDGNAVRVYGTKKNWEELVCFKEKLPKKGVYSLAWGADARTLLIGASDHALRVLGV